jgi:NAD+ kinase
MEDVQTVDASFDGNSVIRLHTGDSVTVRRSSRTAKILKLKQESFLNILRKKMGDA